MFRVLCVIVAAFLATQVTAATIDNPDASWKMTPGTDPTDPARAVFGDATISLATAGLTLTFTVEQHHQSVYERQKGWIMVDYGRGMTKVFDIGYVSNRTDPGFVSRWGTCGRLHFGGNEEVIGTQSRLLLDFTGSCTDGTVRTAMLHLPDMGGTGPVVPLPAAIWGLMAAIGALGWVQNAGFRSVDKSGTAGQAPHIHGT